jgi:CopG family nickel-responsive transcriptional regulator
LCILVIPNARFVLIPYHRRLATLMTGHVVSPSMAEKIRISLSVSQDLLEEFDRLALSLGQPTRSKAVSEAMREFLANRKWDIAKKGQVPGVILVTYDHHSRGVNRALTELQHEYPDVVSATMHLHLSKRTCLEVIAFRGEANRVRALAKTLQSQKGVLDLKLLTSHA